MCVIVLRLLARSISVCDSGDLLLFYCFIFTLCLQKRYNSPDVSYFSFASAMNPDCSICMN